MLPVLQVRCKNSRRAAHRLVPGDNVRGATSGVREGKQCADPNIGGRVPRLPGVPGRIHGEEDTSTCIRVRPATRRKEPELESDCGGRNLD